MTIFSRFNEWIVQREVRSLETSLDLIRRLLFDNKSLLDETIKKKIQVISEELISVQMFYRPHLTREESALILETSDLLEKLWRIYNLPEHERTEQLSLIDPEKIASHISATIPVLQRLIKVNATFEAPLPQKTTRVNIGGIWDLAVLLVMNRIHIVYKDMGYVFIGGVAVQCKIAANTEPDIPKNKIISHICRETHDLDLLFPQDTQPKSRLPMLEVIESFDGLLYEIKLIRDGDRRPIVRVDIAGAAGNYSVDVYLNITTRYQDTRNGTKSSYEACFYETAQKPLTVHLRWNNHPFEFRVIWSERTILHKLERGADKDLQDIVLLMKYDHGISFDDMNIESDEQVTKLLDLLRQAKQH